MCYNYIYHTYYIYTTCITACRHGILHYCSLNLEFNNRSRIFVKNSTERNKTLAVYSSQAGL